MIFADDPGQWFAQSPETVHHFPRAQLDAMQLDALRSRISSLGQRLAPLAALADARGIARIDSLEDAPKLFFHHSVYKSWPDTALAAGDFAAMTDWLARFTIADISLLAGRPFATLDAWMDAIDAETPLVSLHSSGTTGTLSIYPRGKHEVAMRRGIAMLDVREFHGSAAHDPARLDRALVWPTFAHGRSAILRSADLIRHVYQIGDADYFPLLPGSQSSDYQLYVMQVNAARQRGDAYLPQASDYVSDQIDQAVGMQRGFPEFIDQLLDTIEGPLRGRRVIFSGAPVSQYHLAHAAAARGLTGALAPGSLTFSYGGIKGHEPINDLDGAISRFTGGCPVYNVYGMTEISTPLSQCSHGRFHCPPWLIPYVLDTQSGAVLPRQGVQLGRAAFMDLVAQTYWGGIISADLVEMSWNPCSCGRSSPQVGSSIRRLPD